MVIDLSGHSRALLEQARSLGRATWCDLHGDRIGDPKTFARDRIRAGAELVVVTRGAAGAFALASDGIPRGVAAEPVDEEVDTDGAGDAFFAGYLAAHLEGRGVDDCPRAGLARQRAAPRQPSSRLRSRRPLRKGSVRIGQEAVSGLSCGPGESHHGRVIEDLLAAVIGLALLVYLGYALAHPERF